MDGGGWNMLGYNGYNAVRVKTVKSGSVAEQLGILSGDYLVAMNNQWLASPHELSHYLRNESSHKENNINQLQIFRASDNERLMTKNSLFQNSLFEHPLAYRNGKLMTVEIPKTSSLGLAIEPVLVFGRK